MLLSIVVTAYNSNHTISKCLESILESSSNQFELIVVDDCSDDPCAEIVKGVDDNRVRYFFNRVNLGCGLSRNVGIDNIRGQFVTFIDADDWYEKGAVDNILSQLSSSSFDLLVFDFTIVYGSGCVRKKWQPSNDGVIKDFLSDRLISTTWNKVYRVGIITDNKIRFPSYQSQDSVFNLSFFLRCQRIEKLDRFLYFFDKSGESITKSKYSMKSYVQVEQALSDMAAVLQDEPVSIKSSLQEYLRLRRFLFLFKDPVLRIYRDWMSARIDYAVLDEFRNSCDFTVKDVRVLYVSRLLGRKDFFAFLIFKASPRALFMFMKLAKVF